MRKSNSFQYRLQASVVTFLNSLTATTSSRRKAIQQLVFVCFEQRPREDFEKVDWARKKTGNGKATSEGNFRFGSCFHCSNVVIKASLTIGKICVHRHSLVVVLNDPSILDDTVPVL